MNRYIINLVIYLYLIWLSIDSSIALKFFRLNIIFNDQNMKHLIFKFNLKDLIFFRINAQGLKRQKYKYINI